MNRLIVVPATADDPAYLGPRLRAEDLAEVQAASGLDGVEALARGLAHTDEPMAVVEAGRPIALFGVSTLGPRGHGSPWLLGSDRILANWREFARRSREELGRIRAPWTRLENWVDARNLVHVRWLVWLGATFHETDPVYGVGRLPFTRFEL